MSGRDSRGRFLRERPSCHEVGEHCAAPANLIESSKPARLPECFACGEPVCVNCSRRVRWYNLGRKRVAVSCIEEHRK